MSLASRSDRLVNSIQLMFCIQDHALETFEKHAACVKSRDHYPSLRAAYTGTNKAKDAIGVPKPRRDPPRYSIYVIYMWYR